MDALTALAGVSYLGGFAVAVVLLLTQYVEVSDKLSSRDNFIVRPLMLAFCAAWPVVFALWVRARLKGSCVSLILHVWEMVLKVGRLELAA